MYNKKGVSLSDLQNVKTEVPQSRRRDSTPEGSYDRRLRDKRESKRSEFVYVNTAYVGSMNSVNETRNLEPPTSVIREQYWTCSKWPQAQKLLAIAVGVLFGAVIALAIILGLRSADVDLDLPGIFKTLSRT